MPRPSVLLISLVVLSAILWTGCAAKPDAAPNRYKLTGEVVRLDAQLRTAVIKHQKIEGWMEAMTMEFPVKDAGEFARLKPGAKIQATVFQQPSNLDFWIGEIQLRPD